jgi:ribulose-phosphate 3-epimerase
MKKKIYIAPSILSADILKLQEQVHLVEEEGADFIHVDIMDGHFVPNITFGSNIVKALQSVTKVPLDVHLMIANPELYLEQFIDAGANILTVHQESGPHLHRQLQRIRELGAKPGVTINPGTDLSAILPILGDVYLVLLMTVNPGFGGQKFIEFSLDKINNLSKYRQKHNLDFLIEVDGGIDPHTAASVIRAGADILVAGNAIFGQKDIPGAFRDLKKSAINSLD